MGLHTFFCNSDGDFSSESNSVSQVHITSHKKKITLTFETNDNTKQEAIKMHCVTM
jgi:hypothetical protein